MSPVPQAALRADMGRWAGELLNQLIIGMTPWVHAYHSLSYRATTNMNLAVIEGIVPYTNKITQVLKTAKKGARQ